MGLIGEKGPLGDIKGKKKKEKGGGSMGPRAHEGGATPPPLACALPLARDFSPTLLGERG